MIYFNFVAKLLLSYGMIKWNDMENGLWKVEGGKELIAEWVFVNDY